MIRIFLEQFYAVHFKLPKLNSRITFITFNNVLINLCHCEYSECLLLARMQAQICLHNWTHNGIINTALFQS